MIALQRQGFEDTWREEIEGAEDDPEGNEHGEGRQGRTLDKERETERRREGEVQDM